MDIQQALIVFDALSQETRLQVFRLLVQAGPEGMAAGDLSETIGTPHNTMSFHLNHLQNATIVSSRKQGRSMIYSANYALVHELIAFMVRDCCSPGFAQVREDNSSGTSIIEFAGCCSPK